VWNVGTSDLDVKGDFRSGSPTRNRVPRRDTGADGPVVAVKSSNVDGVTGPDDLANGAGQPMMGGADA